MNLLKKAPVFFLLAAGGILLTIGGIIGRNSIYKQFELPLLTKPFLALTMEGADKGIYPWEAPEYQMLAAKIYEAWDVRELAELTFHQQEALWPVINTEIEIAQAEVTDQVGAADRVEVTDQVGAADRVEVTDQVGAADRVEVTDQVGAADRVEVTDQVGDTNQAVTAPVSYEFTTVTEEYFNDALFIGDSRTVGLFEYGGIEERADFYAKVSLTIYDVLTEPIVRDEATGKKITVEEALQKKQYKKIYLMLGLNEMGIGTADTFAAAYGKVVDRLRQLQPDAIIFIEGNMRVTGAKNEMDPIFNNTNINERNAAISKLANNSDIFYIDVNTAVCDAKGNLCEEYTTDEIHLKAQYYELWKTFLLQHGIAVPALG